MKLGILGGTFDPIHNGHLRLAIEAQEQLQLDKVHFIPCQQPVHRERAIATAAHRLAMIQLAIANEPTLCADDREIKRNTPSYMVDTLKELQLEQPRAELYLILGMDAYLGFTTWKNPEEILAIARLVIVNRPGFTPPTEPLAANSVQIKSRLLEISSTEIRKSIAMGTNPRYLLPDNVYDYLKQHGIYQK